MALFKRFKDILRRKLAASKTLNTSTSSASTTSSHVSADTNRKCYRVSGLNFLGPLFRPQTPVHARASASNTQASKDRSVHARDDEDDTPRLEPEPYDLVEGCERSNTTAYCATICRPASPKIHFCNHREQLMRSHRNTTIISISEALDGPDSDPSTDASSSAEETIDLDSSTLVGSLSSESKHSSEQEDAPYTPRNSFDWNNFSVAPCTITPTDQSFVYWLASDDSLQAYLQALAADEDKNSARNAVELHRDVLPEGEDTDDAYNLASVVCSPSQHERDLSPSMSSDHITGSFRTGSYVVYGFMLFVGGYTYFLLGGPPTIVLSAAMRLAGQLIEYWH